MSVRILTADERMAGLGATDVAALVGVNQWKTPIQLWEEKTGQAPPTEQTWRMRLGQLFEDAIADAYAERYGRRLARIGVVHHKRYPFLYAHPDRKVVGEPGLVEVKKTRWAFGDEPPVGYRVQAMWQLALTGREWCDLVSFAGDDIDVHRIDRDDALIEDLTEAAVTFWEHNVQGGIPPEVDGTDAYRHYLARVEPVEEERTATPEQVVLLDELQDIAGTIKSLEARQSLLKNRLAAGMGTATKLIAPQGSVTYRQQAGRVDWQAVAQVMYTLAGVAPELYDEETERHRAEATRVLRVNFKREGA